MNMIRKDEGKRWQQFIGAQGESLARKYFSSKGYEILQTNWRHGHWEVDIIAAESEILHIIEVKTRNSQSGGYPEENVNRKKMLTLMKAAEVYMGIDKRWHHLQFDILAINLSDKGPEFFLLEDVYL
ncbi:MAG TPA: YraN family protein [Chitinophagaceae bacterium]|nr:YraN family protein [Chitinophagaceae bacterium]